MNNFERLRRAKSSIFEGDDGRVDDEVEGDGSGKTYRGWKARAKECAGLGQQLGRKGKAEFPRVNQCNRKRILRTGEVILQVALSGGAYTAQDFRDRSVES